MRCITSDSLAPLLRKPYHYDDGYFDQGYSNALQAQRDAIEMLGLAKKYESTVFLPELYRTLSKITKALVDEFWCRPDQNSGEMAQSEFVLNHYEKLEAYVGAYPRELYPVFAHTWERLTDTAIGVDKLTDKVEQNQGLSVFLAKFFCSRFLDMRSNVRGIMQTADGHYSKDRMSRFDFAGGNDSNNCS
jgi:hypothetical protein